MRVRSRICALVSSAMLVSLASCGGNSDDGAGSPTAFGVFPDGGSLTFPKAAPLPQTCGAGDFGNFMVVGGVAPYHVTNLDTTRLFVSTTVISNRNEVFYVQAVGGCFKDIQVDIQDALDHHVQLKFTSAEVELK